MKKGTRKIKIPAKIHLRAIARGRQKGGNLNFKSHDG